MSAMRTTLDIPDTMYRRIKARTAQEGVSVRKRKTPSWFGSIKVDANLPHDMASIRESIVRHHGE